MPCMRQRLKCLDGSQHLGDVTFNFYLRPNVLNYALAVDDECGALDAHEFFAVHALFQSNAVVFAQVGVFVGHQLKR